MKDFSADLIALLASEVPMWTPELYKIGPLLNGSMIYATNGSSPVTYDGHTYLPSSSGYGAWSRDSITVKIGLDSNSTRLTVFCDSRVPVYFPGTSSAALMLDGIKYGLLGQAPVTIYKNYCPQTGPWGTVTGGTGGSLVETKFVGMAANVEYIGMSKAVIVVQDMLYLLNVQTPRMILQASCSNVLFDTKCTLSASSFQRTNTIGSITNSYTFGPSTNLSTISATGTFTQGTLTFTTGQNAGLSYFVRMWTPGVGAGADTIQLDVAPIFALNPGDGFTITEGCNKTYASCLNLQGSTNSLLNYSGQPNVPVPETAV